MEPYPRKKRLSLGDSFFHSFTFNSKFSRSNFENFSDGCPFFSGCIDGMLVGEWRTTKQFVFYINFCMPLHLSYLTYTFIYNLMNFHNDSFIHMLCHSTKLFGELGKIPLQFSGTVFWRTVFWQVISNGWKMATFLTKLSRPTIIDV